MRKIRTIPAYLLTVAVLCLAIACSAAEGYSGAQGDPDNDELKAFWASRWGSFPEGSLISSDGQYLYYPLEDGTVYIARTYEDDSTPALEYVPEKIDGKTVSAIGSGAFSHGWYGVDVFIPDCVTELRGNPFAHGSWVMKISVSPEHPTLSADGVALISRPDSRLVLCAPDPYSTAAEYVVPDNVRVIGECAFAETLFRSIVIREGVTQIDSQAFATSWAESVTVPASVTRIAPDAFGTPGEGMRDVTLTVVPGSFAEQYCREHGLAFVYP